ncbi:MAG: metal-dependent phosphohydrolase [Myxococcota bacterium]|nr:metal-dependent phosphohydrolase [Myxococcota bacterium]
MFNATEIIIESFIDRLKENYSRTYGIQNPDYPGILAFIGRISLENISKTDAAYHDLLHTILVADVGQEILFGKQLSRGGVTPGDWLNYVTATLCHDIGYVRGVCLGDGEEDFVINMEGERVHISKGATDAALTPYHVDRSKIFVRERFADVDFIDTAITDVLIEATRFPSSDQVVSGDLGEMANLVRGADLIGQMGDPGYLRKAAALFQEFEETGSNARLGYTSPEHLRTGYPKFFWSMIQPDLAKSIKYLNMTQSGKAWVSNLYANVFIEEHSVKVKR